MEGKTLDISLIEAEDVADVAALDQVSISPPWSEALFESERVAPGSRAWVLRLGTQTSGYIIFRASGEDAELLRIAVIPEIRRKGYGSRMLGYALARLVSEGVRRVTLEVRKSNASARAFYEHAGFTDSGTRPRYFSNPEEDAMIMAISLPSCNP